MRLVASNSTPHLTGSLARDSSQEPLTRTALSSNMGKQSRWSAKKGTFVVASSYVLDWFVLIALAIAGYIMGHVSPNMRPFYLADPNIS